MTEEPTTMSKSWVDEDLQETLLASPSRGPRRNPFCENRYVDKVIGCANTMVNKQILIFAGILVILDAIFYILLKCDVINLGSRERDDEGKFVSVEIMMALYTYGCISTFPSVFRNIFRLHQMRISDTPDGNDWEGHTSSNLFDYIPIIGRIFICVLLNLMCILQFINEGIRINIYSQSKENNFDFRVATLFFISSLSCALVASVYLLFMHIFLKITGRAPTTNEVPASSTFFSSPLSI